MTPGTSAEPGAEWSPPPPLRSLDLHSEARPPHLFDRERGPLSAGLLVIVSAVAFEALAVATAMPLAVEDLGGLSLYGWAFSAFMLASLISAVAGSQQADRRGPARPFAIAIACFVAGLAVAGSAPSMPVFILGRALQGLGAGTISAMAYVAIGRGYPEQLRARMLAMMSSAWVLPGLIGPAIAGIVSERLTWRLVLLGLLPLPAVAAALLLPPLRRFGRAGNAPVPPDTVSRTPAALRLAFGTGTALAGTSARPLLLSAVLVTVGVVIAAPALGRLLPPGTMRVRPGLPAGLAARGLLTFGFFGVEAFLPLGLIEVRGISASGAGLALTAASLTWASGSWLAARMDRRGTIRDRQRRTAAGFALMLAGDALAVITVLTSLPVAIAIAAWAVAGLGMGLAYPTISLLVLNAAPAGEEGAISGALQVCEMLSIATSAGLGGAAVGAGNALGWEAPAGLAAAYAIALAGGVLGLAVTRRLGAPGRRAVTDAGDGAGAASGTGGSGASA